MNSEEHGVMQAQVEHRTNEIKVRAANMVGMHARSSYWDQVKRMASLILQEPYMYTLVKRQRNQYPEINTKVSIRVECAHHNFIVLHLAWIPHAIIFL